MVVAAAVSVRFLLEKSFLSFVYLTVEAAVVEAAVAVVVNRWWVTLLLRFTWPRQPTLGEEGSLVVVLLLGHLGNFMSLAEVRQSNGNGKNVVLWWW